MANTKTISHDGKEFGSWEEIYFYWWMKELQVHGYIQDIVLQPKSFELSGQVKVPYVKPMKRVADKHLEHLLLDSHEYTTDAQIIWNYTAVGLFTFGLNQATSRPHTKEEVKLIPANEDGATGTLYSFIEVKPKFNMHNMIREAKINQKWVMEKYNRFVDIIVPEKLFKRTFTPERYLVTNISMKARKLDYDPITLSEFKKKMLKSDQGSLL